MIEFSTIHVRIKRSNHFHSTNHTIFCRKLLVAGNKPSETLANFFRFPWTSKLLWTKPSCRIPEKNSWCEIFPLLFSSNAANKLSIDRSVSSCLVENQSINQSLTRYSIIHLRLNTLLQHVDKLSFYQIPRLNVAVDSFSSVDGEFFIIYHPVTVFIKVAQQRLLS